MSNSDWTIIGAGAIGCLWAASLNQAGLTVNLILRNRDSLKQYPGHVSLISSEGSSAHPCPALIPEQVSSKFERIVIATKAHQTKAAWSEISDKLAPGAQVILAQNGMGVADALLALRQDLDIYCAVTTDGVHTIAPFTVQRAGNGTTWLGRYPDDDDGEASKALCNALENPGITLADHRHIQSVQWEKLAANAIINPLTALYDIPNGDLPDHKQAAGLIGPLCDEIARIASACGQTISADLLQIRVADICRQTADNYSSMLQDLRHGRETEIDFINGYLVDRAMQLGIPCDLNQALVARVKNA